MVSTACSTPSFYSPTPAPHHMVKKNTMSITQTYFLAHRARAKLSAEAARPDHNLRLLVGHANLLDSLMLDLADAEREQESWFNQSVRSSQSQQHHHHQQSQRHVEWADSMTIREEDWEADSSDSDDDSDLDDEEDVEMFDAAPITRISMSTSGSATLHTMETDEEYDDEEDDDEESYSHLGLTRSPSHPASPPELEHDIESSEDEQMPPSPPTASIPTFSEKQSEGTIPTKYYDSTQDDEDDKSDFYSEGFYLPPRDRSRIASGISVY